MSYLAILRSKLSPALFFLVLTLAAPVQALDIGVSPTNFLLSLEQGQTEEHTILLSNKESNSVKMRSFVQAFQPSTENAHDGEVEFSEQFPLPPESQYKVTVSPTTFTLGANESREVTFKVDVKAGAPSAGYYVGIIFQTVPADATPEERVAQFVASEIGIPILTQVGTSLDEKAEIVSFEAEHATYERGPVKFKLDMKNGGKTHFAPVGRVDILTPEGERLDSITFKGKNILPGDSRTTEIVWNKNRLPLGRKKAEVVILYGQETLREETSFEVLPGSFLRTGGLTIGGLILLIFLFGLLGKRKKRRRSR